MVGFVNEIILLSQHISEFIFFQEKKDKQLQITVKQQKRKIFILVNGLPKSFFQPCLPNRIQIWKGLTVRRPENLRNDGVFFELFGYFFF
jgi:hypothetical protein